MMISIKMDLKEVGLGWEVDVIDVTQNSSRWWDVSTVINFQGSTKCQEFLEYLRNY
jgi:hypothetical protein